MVNCHLLRPHVRKEIDIHIRKASERQVSTSYGMAMIYDEKDASVAADIAGCPVDPKYADVVSLKKYIAKMLVVSESPMDPDR